MRSKTISKRENRLWFWLVLLMSTVGSLESQANRRVGFGDPIVALDEGRRREGGRLSPRDDLDAGPLHSLVGGATAAAGVVVLGVG